MATLSPFEALGADATILIFEELRRMYQQEQFATGVPIKKTQAWNTQLRLSHVSSTFLRLAPRFLYSELTLIDDVPVQSSETLLLVILNDRSDMRHHVKKLTISSYLVQTYVMGWSFDTETLADVLRQLSGLRELWWKSPLEIHPKLLSWIQQHKPTLRVRLSIDRTIDNRTILNCHERPICRWDPASIYSLPIHALETTLKWKSGLAWQDDLVNIDFDHVNLFLRNSKATEEVKLTLGQGDDDMSPIEDYTKLSLADSQMTLQDFPLQISLLSLTTLRCGVLWRGSHRVHDLEAISNLILKSIPLWTGLRSLELHNMGANLPFELLETRCPNLHTLEITLTLKNHDSALKFLGCIEPLTKLAVTRSKELVLDIGSILPAGHKKAPTSMYTELLSGEDLTEISTWPQLKALETDISAEYLIWSDELFQYEGINFQPFDDELPSGITKLSNVTDLKFIVRRPDLHRNIVARLKTWGKAIGTTSAKIPYKYLVRCLSKGLWGILQARNDSKLRSFHVEIKHGYGKYVPVLYMGASVMWDHLDMEDSELLVLKDGRKFTVRHTDPWNRCTCMACLNRT